MVAAVTPTKPETAVAQAPKRKVGRPSQTKLTPEVRKIVLDSIALGMPLHRAAIRAGVSERSLVRWREANPEFMEECRKHEADAEAACLASLKSKGEGGNRLWTTDAWLLERRFGYHPVSRSEITGKDGGPIQHLTIAKQILMRAGARGEPKRAEPMEV